MAKPRLAKSKRIGIAALAMWLGLQLVPIRPEPRPKVELSPELGPIQKLVSRSCLDCHGGQTRWPLYAYLAPLSWWIVGHVERGTSRLDLGDWESYPYAERTHLAKLMLEKVEEGEMPLPSYLWMHSGAAVSQRELSELRDWSERLASRR